MHLSRETVKQNGRFTLLRVNSTLIYTLFYLAITKKYYLKKLVHSLTSWVSAKMRTQSWYKLKFCNIKYQRNILWRVKNSGSGLTRLWQSLNSLQNYKWNILYKCYSSTTFIFLIKPLELIFLKNSFALKMQVFISFFFLKPPQLHIFYISFLFLAVGKKYLLNIITTAVAVKIILIKVIH